MSATQLTRREFVAASAGVAGMLATGAALTRAHAAGLSAPRPAAPGAANGTAGARVPHIERSYEVQAGFPRPCAWQRAHGRPRLVLVRAQGAGRETVSIELHETLGAPAVYSREQIVSGLLDERIRHEFGESVLQELLERLAYLASFT